MPEETADIIKIWEQVEIPEAPKVTPVTAGSADTALLILDIQNQNCSQRPRCVAGLPKVQSLLKDAREKKMLVVYTLTKTAQRTDIREEVRPLETEQSVASGVDKFFRTELEDILSGHQIKRVVLVGTAAQGAVLHTATGAALRGFEVIVPVDCVSSVETYAEQYTAWHLVNAPGTKGKCILTSAGMLSLENSKHII